MRRFYSTLVENGFSIVSPDNGVNDIIMKTERDMTLKPALKSIVSGKIFKFLS